MFEDYRRKYRLQRTLLERIKDVRYVQQFERFENPSTYDVVKQLVAGVEKEESKKENYISKQMLLSLFPKGYDTAEEYHERIGEYDARIQAYRLGSEVVFSEEYANKRNMALVTLSIDDRYALLDEVRDMQNVLQKEERDKTYMLSTWHALKDKHPLPELPAIKREQLDTFHFVEYVATYMETMVLLDGTNNRTTITRDESA